MTGSSAYTSLEALLLFQHLYSYGITGTVFGKISELLKGAPDIREAAAFDAGRLSPDALRDFFLRCLKEEANKELKASTDGENQEPSPSQQNPRKRKAPSPTLPTIQDAAEDKHLLPHIIQRLYSRYREQTVAELREDERRHELLTKEVQGIEAGDWDTKLQKEIDEKMRREDVVQDVRKDVQVVPKSATPATLGPAVQAGSPLGEENLGPSSASTHQPLPAPDRPLTTTKPLLASQQGPSHPVGPKPASSSSTPSAHPVDLAPVPQPPYSQRPGTSHENLAGPSNHQILPNDKSPQSPGMLPPPLPGSALSSPSIPQNSVPVGGSAPRYQQVAPNTPAPPTPAAGGPSPQYGQTAKAGHANSYPNSPYPSHRGGVMLQPFQVAPQVPSPIQQQQLSQQASSNTPTRPTQPPRGVAQLNATPQPSPRQRVMLSPILVDIARILSIPNIGSPQRTPVTSVRSATTTWKPAPSSTTSIAPLSPVKPRSRSVSPISVKDSSPEPVSKKTRSSRAANLNNATDSSTHQTRPHRLLSRRRRGGSTTSSVVGSSARGRTRSQSLLSQVSVDNESVNGKRVKHEPSTPAEASDVISETIEETPVPTTAAGRRKAQPARRGKRKRSVRGTSEASETPAADADASYIPAERGSVLAVRNFTRLSAPIMNDILSHKHASIFSNPVRDRDAGGYSDMIRRPTDLKTIKTAINNGGRSVNAATADMMPAAGNATTSANSREAASFLLPWSEDLAPPRGIVNSAQLEKEVMRMFANAVMFNPGEDDVVSDAREMFESAAINIVNFKEAEKGAEAAGRRKAGADESDGDEVMDDTSVTPSAPLPVSKRRKAA